MTTKTIEQNNLIKPPKIGEIIEGKIIGKGKSSVFLSLGNWGTGIIYGKEFIDSKEQLKKLKTGDAIFSKIVDDENEEGYIELSLSKAGKELAWETLKQKKEKDENLSVKILGANKGGLLAEVSGIPAFLPVSQLSSENYPKVEGGDNQKILKALQKFIGTELEVKIFDLDQKEEKLILSEKAKGTGRIKEILENFKVGDIVNGEITGVVDFGAFIKFTPSNSPVKNIEKSKKETKENAISENSSDEIEDNQKHELEGLIHISELDWQLIEDPSAVVKVGQKVKAKIIEISNDKISLSLKALKQDPWENIEEKYNKGDVVKGIITKLNSFGAFVQIFNKDKEADKIQGLCHISEFGSQKKMEEAVKIKKQYNFEIISIEPKEHRMSLKLV
ncbi:MAG: S1 RNA-binding domain-containing protein [Candidatus Nealsonbacteria bacterium]